MWEGRGLLYVLRSVAGDRHPKLRIPDQGCERSRFTAGLRAWCVCGAPCSVGSWSEGKFSVRDSGNCVQAPQCAASEREPCAGAKPGLAEKQSCILTNCGAQSCGDAARAWRY